MQVVLNRPYRPPKLGFIPPPPLRLEWLGEPIPAPPPNTLQGYISQGATNAILLTLGGAGISYFARFFPGVGEPIAMVGGLGLMGLGAYKLYDAVTGVADPVIKNSPLPPGQVADDVFQLTAEIKTPAKNTKVELTNRWALLFQSQKTVAIAFSVTNHGPKPLTVRAEFQTQEFTRPIFGQPDTAKFMTPFLLENIAPGKTKTVEAWHPVDFLNTMFTSLDIAATLNLRTVETGEGHVFATTNFTAG